MKKILSLLLVVCVVGACFAGCSPYPPMTEPTRPPETKPVETPVETDPAPENTEPVTDPEPVVEPTEPVVQNAGVAFESWQSEWVNHQTFDDVDTNVLLSPLSLKMACLLATAGADGETQAQLLNMFGYNNLEDFLAWGERIVGIQTTMEERDVDHTGEGPGDGEGILWYESSMPTRGIFKIANGIWHNTNEPGQFKDEYKVRVERLKAAIDCMPGAELKDAINNWANEATNGLIPEVVGDDVTQQNNILANALYLKAAWVKEFNEYFLEDEDFKTASGEIVKKTMMTQESSFRYYTDADSSMAIFPMVDGFYMAAVKGNADNILEKIELSELKLLNVKMPKFEITHRAANIPQFMKDMGVVDAFNPSTADFSQMMDVDTFISSVQQDSKIIVDENGVEAAAVTVMQMATSSLVTERPVPIDFFLDEAFTFYIYYEVEMPDGQFVPELLFYGEYNS